MLQNKSRYNEYRRMTYEILLFPGKNMAFIKVFFQKYVKLKSQSRPGQNYCTLWNFMSSEIHT